MIMSAKLKITISTIAIVLIIILSTSFDFKDNPAKEITTQYAENIKKLNLTLADLKTNAEKLDQSTVALTKLKESFIQAKNAYKRVEFILAWTAPELVKNFINGAPLPRLEQKTSSINVLQPEGFQVIEELIYSEDVFTHKKDLQELCENLKNKIAAVGTNQSPFTELTILEASRMGLLRILTHGITGFDTPAAPENAILASAISLESIHDAISKFYPNLSAKDAPLVKEIEDKFTSAILYLNNNRNFDDFDRAHLIREYLNPLYGYILDLHLKLEVETIYETTSYLPATNYYGKHIFSDDFMDVRVFTKIKDPEREELIDLGKTLFFDPILSSNNQRSCVSCHAPEKAFTDGLQKSVAYNFDGFVDRNSPTLINAIFADKYFYDLRIEFLEKQTEHVITNHKEFNSSFPVIINKLLSSPEYVERFKKVFPKETNQSITKHSISGAITAYIASLRSFNSDFDKYIRKEKDDIDTDVKKGFNLFMGKAACATCHFAPIFNGTVPPEFHESESEVLGVPATSNLKKTTLDPDRGRANGVFKDGSDIYLHSFKTPTIRNVALTGPYMHNGVFKTLDEVVNFYNLGGGQGIGLNVPNQTLAPDQLNLSKKEIKQLVLFMKSLTDTTKLASKPKRLPLFPDDTKLNQRKIGGEY